MTIQPQPGSEGGARTRWSEKEKDWKRTKNQSLHVFLCSTKSKSLNLSSRWLVIARVSVGNPIPASQPRDRFSALIRFRESAGLELMVLWVGRLAIIRRLVGPLGETAQQLFVFQRRLGPGSTINNELILSACGRRNTPHVFWKKHISFKPYSKYVSHI